MDTLTIGENIVLPLTLDGASIKEQEEKLERVAKILGIESLLEKRNFEVSGGEAQRAAIARALIHDPSMLLADEPTGNLDSKASKTVMELFEKINKEEKVTTMMVTHDPLAASYCNRILFIKDGAIYNSSTISAALLFSFTMLILHPNLDISLYPQYLQQGIKLTIIIAYLFLCFFVFYSVSVFLKSRLKEFGILIFPLKQ